MVHFIRLTVLTWILIGTSGFAIADGNPGVKANRRESKLTSKVLKEVNRALAVGDARGALSMLRERGISLSKTQRLTIEGRAWFLLGKTTQARHKLRAALDLNPDLAEAWYWLGRVYQAAGCPALATKTFRKAQWKGLNTADLHRYWALALRDSNEVLGIIVRHSWHDDNQTPPTAGSFAFNGIVVDSLPSAPNTLIIAPPKSALYQIHKAMELSPACGEATLVCGELWASLGHHQQAVDRFRDAAAHLEGSLLDQCHQQWAMSLLSLADYDGYLKHIRRQMQQDGGVNTTQLAGCYDRAAKETARRGNLKKNILYLTKAVEIHPQVDRIIRLADALQSVHRTTELTSYLHQALDLKPNATQRREIQRRLKTAVILATPALQMRN